MALKIYELNGLTFQFEEGAAPKGARPVDGKAAKPAANKGRTPRNKAAKPAAPAADATANTVAAGVEDASDPDASE